jgi:molybdenum cofactor synthesis domain-containing protein
MGIAVKDYKIIADDVKLIRSTVCQYCDSDKLDLVVTTGGTGLSPRDTTPEAMSEIIERDVPGISETVRNYGQDRMPYSMLSRARAGVRGNTLIINLPGSRGGVADSLDALFPAVLHAFNMMRGGGHHQ